MKLSHKDAGRGSGHVRFQVQFKIGKLKRKDSMTKQKMISTLVCGMLGCLCFGGGDWLMIYGDTSFHADAVSWITNGAAEIPIWRQNLAMALAFPGIILYGVALFSVQNYITDEKRRKVYHYLNAFGLTPWLALHLFYIMILVLFAQLNGGAEMTEAARICGELYSALSWVVIASEAFMLPVFVYWFYLQIRGFTAFPKPFAFTNVLIFFGLLKGATMLMPDNAFRLAFTNGLMSESMIIWFAIILIFEIRREKKQ